MRVIDPGHQYQVTTYDNEGFRTSQIMTFMKRSGPRYPGNGVETYPGTNLQEVLRVCIDRVKYLDGQIHCAENMWVLHRLRECINFLEMRAARRHGRSWNIGYSNDIELIPTCPKCGHIGCEGGCRT
jgi:hypothetical protein